MALQQRGGNKAVIINYIPAAGGAYVTSGNAEKIKEARAAAGLAQTDTFTGNKSGTKSGDFIKQLEARGMEPVVVSGVLETVAHRVTKTSDGTPIHKAAVVLADAESGEKYLLSLEIANRATQMMLDKLENASKGEQISINLFATYEKSGADGQMYTNHGAQVQDAAGNEIKFSPATEEARKALQASVTARRTTLEGGGIKDKAVLAAASRELMVDAYVRVAEGLQAKFGDAPEIGPEGDGMTFDADALVGVGEGMPAPAA